MDLPQRCQRNGCSRRPSQVITYDQYSEAQPRTYACTEHALWWTRGAYGIRMGTVEAMKLKEMTWK